MDRAQHFDAAARGTSMESVSTASLSLLRLCQLVSPALPIGAYHFSQALEYAVHAEWVRDEASAYEWIDGVAHHALATLDIPILLRIYDAWAIWDMPGVEYWSQYLIAARETAELRAEERYMGKALAKILVGLELDAARPWTLRNDASYAAMFALAATVWEIERVATAQAYLWAWTENQVLAALKLLPIGQSSGQRILNRMVPAIPAIVARACDIADIDIGIATVLHGVASCRHETQYSRLFLS